MRSRLKSKFLDMSHYVSLMIFAGLIFQPFWDAEQKSQNVPGIHILFKTQRRRRSMQGCQTWGHQNQTRDSRDSWNIVVLPLSRTLVNQIAASSLRPIKQPFTDSSCPSSLLQSFSSKMFQVCRNIAIIAVVHNQQTKIYWKDTGWERDTYRRYVPQGVWTLGSWTQKLSKTTNSNAQQTHSTLMILGDFTWSLLAIPINQPM